MTNQTNTNGGASVGGNVNAQGDAVLRDKNIYYITVVGHLLDWVQLEGLFPKVENRQDFSSIAEAIEGGLNTRLEGDLADAVAFAGKVLENFIIEHIPDKFSNPRQIRMLIKNLPDYIYERLKTLGYWTGHTQKLRSQRVLWLDATHALLEKYSGNRPRLGISIGHFSRDYAIFVYHLADESGKTFQQTSVLDIEEFNNREITIFVAGVVLDLIRIYSDNTISVQFLQELSTMLKSRRE